jgi:hypothetical protein
MTNRYHAAMRERVLDQRTRRAEINPCGHCGAAFIHFRKCPHYHGAEAMVIRAAAAREAKRRLGA